MENRKNVYEWYITYKMHYLRTGYSFQSQIWQSFSPQLCEGISINGRLFWDRIVGPFLPQNHLAGGRWVTCANEILSAIWKHQRCFLSCSIFVPGKAARKKATAIAYSIHDCTWAGNWAHEVEALMCCPICEKSAPSPWMDAQCISPCPLVSCRCCYLETMEDLKANSRFTSVSSSLHVAHW